MVGRFFSVLRRYCLFFLCVFSSVFNSFSCFIIYFSVFPSLLNFLSCFSIGWFNFYVPFDFWFLVTTISLCKNPLSSVICKYVDTYVMVFV